MQHRGLSLMCQCQSILVSCDRRSLHQKAVGLRIGFKGSWNLFYPENRRLSGNSIYPSPWIRLTFINLRLSLGFASIIYYSLVGQFKLTGIMTALVDKAQNKVAYTFKPFLRKLIAIMTIPRPRCSISLIRVAKPPLKNPCSASGQDSGRPHFLSFAHRPRFRHPKLLGIPGTLLGERLTLAFFVAGTASLFKAYPWRHQYTYKFCSIRGCIFHWQVKADSPYLSPQKVINYQRQTSPYSLLR